MFPYQLHVLQSIQETGKLGALHQGKGYIVAFVNSKDALMTARKIGMVCKVDLGKYVPVKTVITEVEDKGYVELSFDKPYPFTISKNITPNWEWIIESCATMELMRLPIRNTGLVITSKQIAEDDDSMTFEGYIVDPIRDPHLFRESLMNIDI